MPGGNVSPPTEGFGSSGFLRGTEPALSEAEGCPLRLTLTLYLVENLYTVVDRYGWPGLRTVEGKFG